ncbi:hypothetical protein [Coralloluteibacterium thermophilus]|uniref:Uncharacterized protein n=1 Tax=Coralloluteibacterium thermophilum TaxID=2707049 RepID=A0ABV9NN02_9GAMM
MSPTVSPGGPAGSRRRVLPAFLAVLLAAPAVGRAGEAPADGVEFPVWSRSYVGTLGSRTVEVQLERVADLLRGSYCYAPCTEASRWRLYLRGRAVDGGAVLSEEDAGAARTEAAATGHWELDAIDGLPHGAWRSPDGRRVLPLALSRSHRTTHRPSPSRSAWSRMRCRTTRRAAATCRR